MMDRRAFRKKMLVRLAASPVTIGPGLVGLTALMAAWAFDLSGIVTFGGVVALLIGIGMLFTRFALAGNEKLSREVLDEIEGEVEKERNQKLDALAGRLSDETPKDRRDENLLRDLRTLADAFRKGRVWQEGVNSGSLLEILSGVEELFKHCVDTLENTLDLYRTASMMHSKDVRQSVEAERERLLGEVQESVIKLGEILTGLQRLTTSSGADRAARVRSARHDLDRALDVARRVEERMRSIDRQDWEKESSL